MPLRQDEGGWLTKRKSVGTLAFALLQERRFRYGLKGATTHMWARLRAVFRSLFGWMVRGVENPELILRQHIDDMRSRGPEMRRQVAEVIKLEKMLLIQVERLEKKVGFLEPKVVQAVKQGYGQY